MLFQSRNRDAFDFKRFLSIFARIGPILFQSRNRDAFDFKCQKYGRTSGHKYCLFQSRNRDAFDFKVELSTLRCRATIVSIS